MIVVGSRVKYIWQDDEYNKQIGWFPPAGTLGTVMDIDDWGDVCVRWDSGTRPGSWWCNPNHVKEVNTE